MDMISQPHLQYCRQRRGDPLDIDVLSRPIGESRHPLARIVQPDAGADYHARGHGDGPPRPTRRKPARCKPTVGAATPDPLPDADLELGRNALRLHSDSEAGSELCPSLDLRGTRRAVLDMPQDLVVRLNK